jgi:hypothetical protein
MTKPILEGVFRETDEVIAIDVTADDYMELYAEYFCEWVDGVVSKKASVNLQHMFLWQYVDFLIRAYLEQTELGMILSAPFVMKLDVIPS